MTSPRPPAARRLVGSGLAFDLPEDGELLIGRARNSDLRLTHPTVSRRHAVLTLRPFGVVVTDQGALAGTFVNDRPVRDAAPVAVGDTLRLGGVALVLVDAAATSAPRRRWWRLWTALRPDRSAGRTRTGH